MLGTGSSSCFGALCYKPQLAVLIPLGLAVIGRWRALAAMAATALALGALSFGVFGAETWCAFLAETPLARATMEQSMVDPAKMQSVFAGVRVLGGGTTLAYAFQAAVAIPVVLVLIVALRKTGDALAQGALIAAAAPLVTPFVLDYDLTLLACRSPFCWRGRKRRNSFPLKDWSFSSPTPSRWWRGRSAISPVCRSGRSYSFCSSPSLRAASWRRRAARPSR
jgi:hypothetical protein